MAPSSRISLFAAFVAALTLSCGVRSSLDSPGAIVITANSTTAADVVQGQHDIPFSVTLQNRSAVPQPMPALGIFSVVASVNQSTDWVLGAPATPTTIAPNASVTLDLAGQVLTTAVAGNSTISVKATSADGSIAKGPAFDLMVLRHANLEMEPVVTSTACLLVGVGNLTEASGSAEFDIVNSGQVAAATSSATFVLSADTPAGDQNQLTTAQTLSDFPMALGAGLHGHVTQSLDPVLAIPSTIKHILGVLTIPYTDARTGEAFVFTSTHVAAPWAQAGPATVTLESTVLVNGTITQGQTGITGKLAVRNGGTLPMLVQANGFQWATLIGNTNTSADYTVAFDPPLTAIAPGLVGNVGVTAGIANPATALGSTTGTATVPVVSCESALSGTSAPVMWTVN